MAITPEASDTNARDPHWLLLTDPAMQAERSARNGTMSVIRRTFPLGTGGSRAYLPTDCGQYQAATQHGDPVRHATTGSLQASEVAARPLPPGSAVHATHALPAGCMVCMTVVPCLVPCPRRDLTRRHGHLSQPVRAFACQRSFG
ncbi:hypothetical protein SDC9_62840 [bioreactor metagenome]|uniref:Uncharacterized protein n=1 Tax=bioreactor metagenome TaxID=1076179 RepID=A0A644XJV2_9ZZZZ